MQKNVTRSLDLPIILLVLYTCTYFVYYDLGIRAIYYLLIFVIFFVAGFLKQMRTKYLRHIKINSIKLSFIFLAFVMFVIFIRPDSTHNKSTVAYTGIIVLCALMLLISDTECKSAEKSLKMLAFTSMMIAGISIFFTLNKKLYSELIYPILGSNSQSYFELTSVKGYGISLGGVTYTAYFLSTGIAILHGYIISKKHLTRRKYIQILCLAGILFVSLVLLGRKGELISVILSLFMMWGINYSIKKGRVGKGGFLMLVWMIPILAIIIYFYLPKFLNSNFLQRYLIMFDNFRKGQDFTSGRIQLWKWGWELFIQYPVFGGGLGSYSRFIPEAWRITGAGTVIESPHIVYLHFLCEFGIVGFTLLMIPLTHIFIKTLKQYIRLTTLKIRKGNKKQEELTLCINASSLFLQIFFAFLFFFDQTFSLIQFWFFYCITVYFSSFALYYKPLLIENIR